MILCRLDCAVLEEGTSDEVKIGSSILYDATTYAFDGSLVEVCACSEPAFHFLSFDTNSSSARCQDGSRKVFHSSSVS